LRPLPDIDVLETELKELKSFEKALSDNKKNHEKLNNEITDKIKELDSKLIQIKSLNEDIIHLTQKADDANKTLTIQTNERRLCFTGRACNNF
jgi:predicted  nucleic acid-binding Zn-ribbon protein